MEPERFSNPRYAVPAGACDCHMHVFGPIERYPPAPRRAYTPLPAPLTQWRALAARLGFTRVVLVQPSAYGTDNRCAGRRARRDRARPRAASPSSTRPRRRPRSGAPSARRARASASMSRRWRWRYGALRRRFGACGRADRPARLACADLCRSADDRGVGRGDPHRAGAGRARSHGRGAGRARPARTDSARSSTCSARAGAGSSSRGAYRVSDAAPGFADATPIARALVAANPDRLVWGTDWPHIGGHVEAARAERAAGDLSRSRCRSPSRPSRRRFRR